MGCESMHFSHRINKKVRFTEIIPFIILLVQISHPHYEILCILFMQFSLLIIKIYTLQLFSYDES